MNLLVLGESTKINQKLTDPKETRRISTCRKVKRNTPF